MSVAGLLADALDGRGSASVRELVAAVRAAGGSGVSRAAIERVLRDDVRFVPDGDPGKARWRLADAAEAAATEPDATERDAAERDAAEPGATEPGATETTAADEPRAAARRPGTAATAFAGLELRPWQAEALAAWSTTCRGVVEAVTGTGKTRLAMAAIRVVLGREGRALVLVPTLELQDQWVRELRALVPGVSVGRMGGGHDDDLFSHEVVVSTPHSAAAVPVDLPAGSLGLLVADEAHRYGAPTWGEALHEVFALRLALTATYERGDDGLVDVLEPYFGEVVFRYGYDRAVLDGTVAPFRIALVGAPLTPPEQEAHDAADVRVRQLHRELVGGLGMPKDPRKLFAAVSAIVAEGESSARDGTQVRSCREYLARVRERRDIAASATGKLDICSRAAAGLTGRRSLVFTDTVEQADAAAAILSASGVPAETVHGGLPTDRRRIRLALFRRGDLAALVAPRVLDEGVDVPDADVALVLAAFRTRRQLVQRLGRVLRLKADGRTARLVLAYARGTAEDPDRGGHRDFLAEVRGVAREVSDVPSVDVGGWLGAPDGG